MTQTVLQLHVELEYIQPPIWRRLQIPSDASLWDLHVAIQSAFAWTDTHLHEFRALRHNAVHQRFGIPMDEFEDHGPELLPCWEHRVADLLTPNAPQIEYEYDFGDGWLHRITLEGTQASAPGKRYPRCTDGARSAPPDDCGGPPGYEDLLAILANPSDPEYASSHVWATSQKGIRGRFDPEAFDEQLIRFANPKPRLKRLLAFLASQG